MSPALLKDLCYVACGSVGALIGAMSKSHRLQLPRLIVTREADGEVTKSIDPGFLAAIPAGSLIAWYVDGNPFHAICYGLVAGYVGPGIVRVIVEPIIAKLGLTTDLVPQLPATTPTKDGSQ